MIGFSPRVVRVLAALALSPAISVAQGRITSPAAHFGRAIGSDYFLVNYSRMLDYWRKLDRESDRMRLVNIGTTAEGRPMVMAIVTSPENHRRLGRYQEISRRLARAEGLSDDQARALAAEGKAVVWIDGGLHATEVLGSQQLIQTAYELVSGNDAETRRFMRDLIVLLVPANPDGQDLVADWYMREPDSLRRTTRGLPRLYQKYIGHDNNRDSFLASQPETQAMDSILFRAWYPQIMYNHHQTGPRGAVLFAPPFRDPFNYNFDPLIPTELDLVGAAMHSRFVAEGKPGAVMRSGANYSTWWNGGLRTTVYFHNMIGLLTETIGHPTPMRIPIVPERLLPSSNQPMPITPQPWRFAQSLAYSLTANRAVLDVASRYRETFLYNIYRMGRNSIERGSRDTWTVTPGKVAAVQAALARDSAAKAVKPAAEYLRVLNDPATRDPRGYIIPANQRDFPTAVKFVNALVKTGITVHRARSPFAVAGKSYPAGSLVVKTAQAFRPHVLDMFEPQDHPNDIPYPGGPPTPPYDNAGWTLAYQMGVEFDRILVPFDGPFDVLAGFAAVPASVIADGAEAWFVPRSQNDAFVAVNRALAAGIPVSSLDAAQDVGGTAMSAGTFVFPRSAAAILGATAADKGITVVPGRMPPASAVSQVRPVRVALWDQYGGSMTSGWTRFLLERFEFPFQLIFPPDIDAGKLSQFDVLVLPGDATIGRCTPRRGDDDDEDDIPADRIPGEFRGRIGRMTEEKTLPAIRTFLQNGGRVLAAGNASCLGLQLDLPLASATADSAGRRLPRSKFYVPGSVLRVRMDTTSALAWGMRRDTDVFYNNNPAFRVLPGAASRGIRRVAWFDSASPLRSGWAWGQQILEGAAQVVEADVGRGKLVLYGPDVQFRHQSHGTFKLLFHGIYLQPK